jgi:hypothetical protein
VIDLAVRSGAYRNSGEVLGHALAIIRESAGMNSLFQFTEQATEDLDAI